LDGGALDLVAQPVAWDAGTERDNQTHAPATDGRERLGRPDAPERAFLRWPWRPRARARATAAVQALMQ
jgi:hypothetical protein